MASPDVRNILRVPGYLVKDPTSVASAFPHGGTALGLVRNIEVRLTQRAKLVTAEEWGSTTSSVIWTGESAILAAILRTWDSALVGAMFPTASGSTVQSDVDGSVRAGKVLTPFKLLFSPVAIDHHPLVYFPAAVALPDPSAKLSLALDSEIGVGAVFHATPDSAGYLYKIGTRGSFSL